VQPARHEPLLVEVTQALPLAGEISGHEKRQQNLDRLNYRVSPRGFYTPLLASFVLFLLLMLRGSRPTGSDSE